MIAHCAELSLCSFEAIDFPDMEFARLLFRRNLLRFLCACKPKPLMSVKSRPISHILLCTNFHFCVRTNGVFGFPLFLTCQCLFFLTENVSTVQCSNSHLCIPFNILSIRMLVASTASLLYSCKRFYFALQFTFHELHYV